MQNSILSFSDTNSAAAMLSGPRAKPSSKWLVHAYNFKYMYFNVVCACCRYIRHPGYLGWLVWAVGTQILLANPICTIAFAVVVSVTTILSSVITAVFVHYSLSMLNP